MKLDNKYKHYTKLVLKKNVLIFLIVCIVFMLCQIPCIVYLQNIFMELQIEKIKQKLSDGALRIEQVVKDVGSASETVSGDTRFIRFAYLESKRFKEVEIDTLIQMRRSYRGLMKPLDFVCHYAMEFVKGESAVFAQNNMYLEDLANYYPGYFSVADLSVSEWREFLAENGSGFLPAMEIRLSNNEQTVLIYNKKVSDYAYMYACIRVDDLKKLLCSESDRCTITILKKDGTILYSDAQEETDSGYTVTTWLPVSAMEVRINVDKTILWEKMYPAYFFIVICLLSNIGIALVCIRGGSNYTAKPMLSVLNELAESRNLENSGVSVQNPISLRLREGDKPLQFVSECIRMLDMNLGEIKENYISQVEKLRKLYIEKALFEQLNVNDKKQIAIFFPDFPQNFYLLSLQLWVQEEHAVGLYENPLGIVQSFLSLEMPNMYFMQQSDTEALFVLSEEDFLRVHGSINMLIDNINREEPCYTCRCKAGTIHHGVEELSEAYRQIQEIGDYSYPDEDTRIILWQDYHQVLEHSFNMADFYALHTAISHGNREVALARLQICVGEEVHSLQSFLKRNTYEMLRVILNGFQREYPSELLEYRIPLWERRMDMYPRLKKVIADFCEIPSRKADMDRKSGVESKYLVTQILEFIDENYTDSELCMTVLEQKFKCAPSTIRKLFKSATNITISHYIEKKRMSRAEELLAEKNKTVAQIARECGYSSQNSFYKAYRRIYGRAPKDDGEE